MIPHEGLEMIRKHGIEVTIPEEKSRMSQEELIEQVQHHEAMISAGYAKLDAHFLQACRHLKVVALHSVGFDNVDIAEATRLHIPVGHTPGVVSRATADVAFMLLLASSRKAFYMNHEIVRGNWKDFNPVTNLGIELYGKTLGIFGLGKIGYEMARLCSAAYHMKVQYHNRSRNRKAEDDFGAKYVSFEELVQTSDVVSVHTNLTEETRGKFNRDVFAQMKPSAIFINTARGNIHNEEDLIDALNKGVIWGAGLDVTNPEPMKPNNPLLTMPNVAVTPHIGTATVETRNAQSRLTAENVIAALSGEKVPYIVNPEVYHRRR